MKRKICLVAGVCVAVPAVALAQSQIQPAQPSYTTTTTVSLWPGYTGPKPQQAGDMYFNMEFGGNLIEDINVRSTGQKVGVDAGFAGNFNFGYDITDALAIEFQTGMGYNSLNTTSTALTFGGHFADMYQFPLMANLIFNAPLPGGLTPYVGAGFGGMVTEIELYNRGFYANDTDITPAYQVLAGLKCAINRRTEIGVGYRFLATTDHTWFADSPVLYSPTGPLFENYIMATFTFSF